MKEAIGDWTEVADILNAELNYNRSESAYRKPYQYYEQFAKALKNDNEDETVDRMETLLIEIKKEKQKLSDIKSALNEKCRKIARDEEIAELITDYFEKGSFPSLNYISNKNVRKLDKTTTLISLNDIHYGACYSNNWNKYNPEICRERFVEYLKRIAEIQKIQNSEDCYVWMNGDAISGNIHETVKLANKENVVKQVMEVSELVAQFLAELSRQFPKVYFMSVSGNHSRLTKKEDAPKGERLDDIVEFYCKARLQDNNRIIFDAYDKIDNTMYVVNIRNRNYAGIHGDYDKSKAGIANLELMANRKLYGVLTAHMHHNAIDSVQGINLIMAGSFQGMDDFTIERRILGYPEQLVTILNDDGIYCHYPIRLK